MSNQFEGRQEPIYLPAIVFICLLKQDMQLSLFAFYTVYHIKIIQQGKDKNYQYVTGKEQTAQQ
jgi:hypothetical protein